jgi:hypothetical protein
MWRRVYFVWIDVSEERIASIFRVEKPASEEPAWLQPPAHVVIFSVYSLFARKINIEINITVMLRHSSSG